MFSTIVSTFVLTILLNIILPFRSISWGPRNVIITLRTFSRPLNRRWRHLANDSVNSQALQKAPLGSETQYCNVHFLFISTQLAHHKKYKYESQTCTNNIYFLKNHLPLPSYFFSASFPHLNRRWRSLKSIQDGRRHPLRTAIQSHVTQPANQSTLWLLPSSDWPVRYVVIFPSHVVICDLCMHRLAH